MSSSNILKEVLTTIAESYHSYLTSKGYPVTLEECYGVLELPVPTQPITQITGTSTFQSVSSPVPGFPGVGPTQADKKPSRRGGRKKTDTSVNPHLNLGPAPRAVKDGESAITVGPPVEGYCSYTLTKGARVGRYCTEKVDVSKPDGKYCKRCAGKGQAATNAGGVAPNTFNFSAGFHSSIPNKGESVSLNTYPYGDSEFHIISDTDLIIKFTETPGETLVCGWLDNGDINCNLESKYDQIRRLKLQIVDKEGKKYYPPESDSTPATLQAFQIPTPNNVGFQAPVIPGFQAPVIPGFQAPKFQTPDIPGLQAPKFQTPDIPEPSGVKIPTLNRLPFANGSTIPTIPSFNMSAFTPSTIPNMTDDEDDE